MNKRFKSKRGFTLVELLIVVAIVVVITAIATPMLINYFRTSQMIKYNDYAKTIYLSAQSYLSDKKSAGKLQEVKALTNKKVTTAMVKGEYYGGEDLSYMMLSKKGSDPDSKLREMLEDYIGDPSILEESICVEYNAVEGVVYSVSYSESADGFFYDMSTEKKDGNVSISDRSSDKKEKLRFGYYAAKVPSGKNRDTLKTAKVTLNNKNQLYANWTDARPNNKDTTANINYTVKVYDKNSKYPVMSFVVDSSKVVNKTGTISTVGHYLVECPTTYYKSNGKKEKTVTESHWVYSIGNPGSKTYSFVIDSIDTSANVAGTEGTANSSYYSVLKRYPKIGDKDIRVSVKAASGFYRPNMVESTSKIENTLFEKEEKPGNSTDKQAIKLANARHLYNVRYKESNENEFTQTSDISWVTALEDGALVNNGTILSKSGMYRNGTSGQLKPEKDIRKYAFETINYKEKAFAGTYDGGKHKIQDLYLTGQYNKEGKIEGTTGLFAQNKGTIKNVEMTGLTVRSYGETADQAAVKETGTIVGANLAGGTVSGVKINAIEVTGGTYTGGIAGKNSGTIISSNTDCKVVGVSHVGGIVGYNEGTGSKEGIITDCNTTGGYVEGIGNNVGGIIGSNVAAYLKIEGFENKAEVKAKNYAGGIIGNNEKGTIAKCKNKGIVWATEKYAGGITGANGKAGEQTAAKIDTCVSEVEKKLTEEEQKLRAQGDYIGGITGYNNGIITATSENAVEIKSVVMGRNFVGGVAGHNDTYGFVAYYELKDGQVIASGNFAGGMFGLNTSREFSSGDSVNMAFYSNPSLIKGNNYVGGVIGANLVVVGGTGNKTLTFTSTGKGRRGDKIEANAYAGGVIGYNGVIAVTGSNEDEQLQKALAELIARDPFQEETKEESPSNIKTRITNSSNFLDITAKRYVGGIIGQNSDASVLEVDTCINYGNLAVVKGSYAGSNYYIGGITGRNSRNGVIRNAQNAGNVTSLSQYTGGITEVNEGLITKCKNSGTITSSRSHVGGITGRNGVDNGDAIMEECEAAGSVIIGTGYMGALAGQNNAVIRNCDTTFGMIGQKGGTADYVGGMVGYNGSGGQLNNVNSLGGLVYGRNYVGGIAGISEISIGQLTNAATVDGKDHVGGIIGGFIDKSSDSDSGRNIEKCVNTGNITGTIAGGITGVNKTGDTIEDCNSSGNVTVTGTYAGGIVSTNDGIITGCTVTGGTVKGNASVGGLVGNNDINGEIKVRSFSPETLVADAKIQSQSTTTGDHYVGGLMAYNNSTKQRIISDVQIKDTTITATVSGKKQYVGGIVGANRKGDTISNCNYYGTSAGKASISGGVNGTGGITGKNAGIVNHISLGKNADLITVASIGISGGFIGICENGSLQNSLTNGLGLNVKGTKWVGGYYGKYECTDNTVEFKDLTNYASVSGNEVTGGFIGEITGANADSEDAISLVNCVNYGTIEGKETASSTAYDLGGLVGIIKNQNASIKDCRNKGSIEGRNTRSTGGIIGRVINKANTTKKVVLSNCTNEGTIKNSTEITGGIIGNVRSAAEIKDCSNQGEINTTGQFTGGIVGNAKSESGDNGGITIEKCRNLNKVTSTGTILGGIVGHIDSNNRSDENTVVKVIDCSNGSEVADAASVVGEGTKVGGIVGTLRGKLNSVSLSYNYGTVKSNKDLTGGIVGYIDTGGIISGCYNEGIVDSSAGYVGGILGQSHNGDGVVEDCVNREKGTVSGNQRVGGISGSMRGPSIIIRSQNEGQIKKGTNFVGGICGEMEEAAKIEKCTNEEKSVLAAKYNSIYGGIIGYMRNGTILDCVNKTPISLDTTTQVGGIVGKMEKGTVRNSENHGGIKQNASLVGGIIGYLSTSSEVTIEGNVNHAAVEAAAPFGGIIGKGDGGGTVNISTCRNEGKITNIASGSDGMGGVIGFMSNLSGTVKNNINYGEVSQQLQNYNVGGVIGTVANVPYGRQLQVVKCANYGAINKALDLLDAGGKYGGIVGSLSDNSRIESCYNFGEINLSKVEIAGGIVGNSGSKTTILNSINSADITTQESNRLGGIAGDLKGQVVSCQNTKLNMNDMESFTGDMQEVFKDAETNKPSSFVMPEYKAPGTIKTYSGGNQGGIVGRTWTDGTSWANISSEIPSDSALRSAYNYTMNSMTIERAEAEGATVYGTVGGIVGHLEGGSVVKAYNVGEIIVPKRAINVGGIAGRITKKKENTATIAGAFHIGTISEGNTFYKGGISGFRDKDENVTGILKPSVKDSFYGASSVPETTVTGISGKWRIGNEPSDDVTPDIMNDSPKSEPDGGKILGEFSEKGFGKVHGVPEDFDYDDKSQSIPLIQEYLSTYQYKLDAPEITSVSITPETSNSYGVAWTGGQGSVRAYELQYRLFRPDGTEVVLNPPITSGEIPYTNNRLDGQVFEKKYIGYFFQVGVRALGVAGETVDSDVNWKDDKYLILPPMLKPEIEYQSIGPQQFRFTVTNMEAYLEALKPVQDFENLAEFMKPDGDPAYKEAYQDYKNKLAYIDMYIPKTKETIRLTEKDGVYSADHTFDIGTAIKEVIEVQFKAVPKVDIPYTYYVSDLVKKNVEVTKTYQLEAPKNVKVNYTGDTEKAGYEVQFDTVLNGKTYQLKVYHGSELVETKNITASSGTQTVTLNPAIFSEERLGTDFRVELQSIGDGVVYLTSGISEKVFTAVKRLDPPRIRVERLADTDKYTIIWSEAIDGKYSIDINQKDMSTGELANLMQANDTAEKQFLADYTEQIGNPVTDILNGYLLSAVVRQLGIQGESLSSVTTTMDEYPVYKRLPKVEKLTHTVDKDNLLSYTFNWSEYLSSGEVTAENCDGYRIYAKKGDNIVVLGSVGTYNTTIYTHVFGADEANSTLDIFVVAIGKEGKNSNSKQGTMLPINLPQRAEKPINFAVVPDAPIADPVNQEEFEKITYTASWKLPDSSSVIISSFNLQIVDEMGKVLLSESQMITPGQSDYSKSYNIVSDYAGQTLYAKVQSCPTTGIGLNSEWVELSFTVPKIKLEAVKELKCEKIVIPVEPPTDPPKEKFEYKITFDGVPYATAYQVVAVDAAKPDIKLYDEKVSDSGTGSKTHTIPPEKAEAIAQAIGTGKLKVIVTSLGDVEQKHYVDSEPASIEAASVSPVLSVTLTDKPDQFKFSWMPDSNMEADKYRVRILKYDIESEEQPAVLFESNETNQDMTEMVFDYSSLPQNAAGYELVFMVEQMDVWEEIRSDGVIEGKEAASMSAVFRTFIAP